MKVSFLGPTLQVSVDFGLLSVLLVLVKFGQGPQEKTSHVHSFLNPLTSPFLLPSPFHHSFLNYYSHSCNDFCKQFFKKQKNKNGWYVTWHFLSWVREASHDQYLTIMCMCVKECVLFVMYWYKQTQDKLTNRIENNVPTVFKVEPFSWILWCGPIMVFTL